MNEQIAVKERPFALLDFILQYKNGELSEDGIIAGFQELINSGDAWSLQGHYGRTARALIESGACHTKV